MEGIEKEAVVVYLKTASRFHNGGLRTTTTILSTVDPLTENDYRSDVITQGQTACYGVQTSQFI
jgi:hypothetical protein